MFEKCNKCNKKIDTYNYVYPSGLCDDCKSIRTHNFIILALVLGFVGAAGGFIDYEYEVSKCNNLRSSQSNYDFDLIIEKNAEYNSDCYYLENHPLALTGYVLRGGVIFVLGVGILVFVVWMWRSMS